MQRHACSPCRCDLGWYGVDVRVWGWGRAGVKKGVGLTSCRCLDRFFEASPAFPSSPPSTQTQLSAANVRIVSLEGDVGCATDKTSVLAEQLAAARGDADTWRTRYEPGAGGYEPGAGMRGGGGKRGGSPVKRGSMQEPGGGGYWNSIAR